MTESNLTVTPRTAHLNGVNISNQVLEGGLSIDGGSVTLDFVLGQLALEGFKVEVDDETRAVLIELGWTPPTGDDHA